MTTLVVISGPQTLGTKVGFCAMLAFFGLIGLALLSVAFRDMRRAWRAWNRFVKCPGTVTGIRTETKRNANPGGESYYDEKFFPVVAFTAPDGKRVEFRSELGESYRIQRGIDGSKIERKPSWREGQAIDVFFDPQGEFPPCISVGWALWFMPLGFLAAGLMALGFVTVIAMINGPKIFA